MRWPYKFNLCHYRELVKKIKWGKAPPTYHFLLFYPPSVALRNDKLLSMRAIGVAPCDASIAHRSDGMERRAPLIAGGEVIGLDWLRRSPAHQGRFAIAAAPARIDFSSAIKQLINRSSLRAGNSRQARQQAKGLVERKSANLLSSSSDNSRSLSERRMAFGRIAYWGQCETRRAMNQSVICCARHRPIINSESVWLFMAMFLKAKLFNSGEIRRAFPSLLDKIL
jgi:hypothetical protein